MDSIVDEYGEDTLVIIPDWFVSVTLQDIIHKHITDENYRDIIKLAEYIMVENVDLIVDEIVRVTNNVHVVYEFEQFYRLSDRLKPLTQKQLSIQLSEYNETNMEMFYKYGHSSFWDVSKLENMSYMLDGSQFNGDISRWDVSHVTTMEGMFWQSHFNGDISRWDVSRVRNMERMFNGSRFNGDLSQWNVSDETNVDWMFYHSEFNGNISKWAVKPHVHYYTPLFVQSSNQSIIKNDALAR